MQDSLQNLLNSTQKNLNKLRLGFFLITIGSFVYFALLIIISIQIFSIFNWYFGVILPGLIFILGLLTVLMTVRYVFSIFIKISNNKNQIYRKNEPELFHLLDEIIQELGLKKVPKIYIEDVNAITTTYTSQFNALFNPSQFNLIIGINHFQLLNRTELKSLIKEELVKYQDENQFKLIQFRNWEFSTHIMFYSSELTESNKDSKYKIMFFYIYVSEYFLLKVHRQFSSNIQQFENEIKKKDYITKTHSTEYLSAIHKMINFSIIKYSVDEYLTNTLQNFYEIPNKYEVYREVFNRPELRELVIKTYYDFLSNSTIYHNYIASNYFKDYFKYQLNKKEFNPTEEEFADIIKLNQQDYFEQLFIEDNNKLNEIKTTKLVDDFEQFNHQIIYPIFFEKLSIFMEFDFEKLNYSPIDSDHLVTKQELINSKNLDVIEETNTLFYNIQFFRTLDEFEFEGKIYNNLNDRNKLIEISEFQYFKNIDFINELIEKIYIYLKTNQVDESKEYLKTILKFNKKRDQSLDLLYETDELKTEIYTETRRKILEELYVLFDAKIQQIKESLQEIIQDPELNNIFPKESIDFINSEMNQTIIYYENGIYSKEGFDRISYLASWNHQFTYYLVIRYSKIYFDLNKHLVN